jgi:energy-coupling factor transporter ATP-binding protein EcfA2
MNQIKYLEYLVDEIDKYGPLDNFNKYSISCSDVEHVLDLLKSLLNYGLHIIDVDIYEKYLTIHKNLSKIQLIDACNSTQMDRPLIQRESIDPVINYDLFPLNDNDIETIKNAFAESIPFRGKDPSDDDDKDDKKENQQFRNNIIKSQIIFSHEKVSSFQVEPNFFVSGLLGEFSLLLNNLSSSFRKVDLNPNKLKSFLLYGPPGSGKSSLVRYLGMYMYNDISALFSVSTSRIKSKYVGESGKNVRALFEVCRTVVDENPDMICVIFLDEIDSLFPKDPSVSSDIQTEFLVQMEGLETGGSSKGQTNKNIILIAATNYPSSIPSNILSRFTTKIRVSIPYPVLSTDERINYMNGETERSDAIRNANFYDLKSPVAFITNFLLRYDIPFISFKPSDKNVILKLLWDTTTPSNNPSKITNNDNDGKFSDLSYLTQRGLNNFLTVMWKKMIGKSIDMLKELKDGITDQKWIRWVINKPISKNEEEEDIIYKTSNRYIPTTDEHEYEDLNCIHNINKRIRRDEKNPHFAVLCNLRYNSELLKFEYKIDDDGGWKVDEELEQNISAPVIRIKHLIKSIEENREILVTQIKQDMIDKIWVMDPNWIPLLPTIIYKEQQPEYVPFIENDDSTKFDMVHIHKVVRTIFPEANLPKNEYHLNMNVGYYWYYSDTYFFDMLGYYLNKFGKKLFVVTQTIIDELELKIFLSGLENFRLLLYNKNKSFYIYKDGANCIVKDIKSGDNHKKSLEDIVNLIKNNKQYIVVIIFNDENVAHSHEDIYIEYDPGLRYISEIGIGVGKSSLEQVGFVNLRYIFFEKQERLMCGSHAINNMMGYKLVECDELQQMCIKMQDISTIEYCNDEGNFHSDVLYCYLYSKSMHVYEVVDYNISIDEIAKSNFKGFLINLNGIHWVAIRYIKSPDNVPYQFAYLDSLSKNRTIFLTSNQVYTYLTTNSEIKSIAAVVDNKYRIPTHHMSEVSYNMCPIKSIKSKKKKYRNESSDSETSEEFESYSITYSRTTDHKVLVTHNSNFIRQTDKKKQSGSYAINNLLERKAINDKQLKTICSLLKQECEKEYDSKVLVIALKNLKYWSYEVYNEELYWQGINLLNTPHFIGFLVCKNKWIVVKIMDKHKDELTFSWINSTVAEPVHYGTLELIKNMAGFKILAIYSRKVEDENILNILNILNPVSLTVF